MYLPYKLVSTFQVWNNGLHLYSAFYSADVPLLDTTEHAHGYSAVHPELKLQDLSLEAFFYLNVIV